MSISDIGSPVGPANHAAFLPLNRPGAAGFSDTLREQVRGELARDLAGARQAPPATTGTYSAHTANIADGDAAGWAGLTRTIGGQYLSPQVADVFTRQMALESGNFSPDVIYGQRVSSAGAQGIAQLMPSSYPGVNRLDPVASLHAAAATMRDNLLTFGGDLRKALAAYNAGTGLVQNLVSSYGTAWESGLPAESRQYLQLLLG